MKHAKLATALCIVAIAGLSGYSGYRLGIHLQHETPVLPLNTQFVQAATRGDLNEMERLHKLGADVNGTQDPSGGFTALDRASDHGYVKIVSWLLAHGADPARGVDHGQLALAAAQHRLSQASEVTELLLSRLLK